MCFPRFPLTSTGRKPTPSPGEGQPGLSLGPGLKPCLCNSPACFCWKDILKKPSLISGSASGEPDLGPNQRHRVVERLGRSHTAKSMSRKFYPLSLMPGPARLTVRLPASGKGLILPSGACSDRLPLLGSELTEG